VTTVKHTAGPWQIRRVGPQAYSVSRRTPEGGRKHLAGKPTIYPTLEQAQAALAKATGRTA
jgi:hypothetical protein